MSVMSWKNIYLDNYSYFFTNAIVDKLPVLIYSDNIRAILELMNYYRAAYRTKIQAYVIMPTHLHMILHSEKGENLRSFVQNLLRKSAIRIVAHFCKLQGNASTEEEAHQVLESFRFHSKTPSKHKVWKRRPKGVPIYSDRIMKLKMDYIHNNPIRAGLVKEPKDYLYSSFRNYYLNDHSVFEIDCVDILNLKEI